MNEDLASRLADFDQHHLGDRLDRSTFVTLLVTTFIVPVVALVAGWMWL